MGIVEIRNIINSAPMIKKESKLLSFNVKQFLEKEFPLREFILSPIIPTQGLVMIYAPRGIGKTFVSLSIACSVASGESMFDGKWICEKPRKVLFVDGEMPASVLQERLAGIISSMETNIDFTENLEVITQDLQELGIADLSSNEGQKHIEEHLEGVELLILDNLSSLCRSGRENESESWLPLQEWLLTLRRRNISVLIVHHAGKNGNQRGNSKKEDLLDTVIALKKPDRYTPSEGARFEVHYEKARGFYGKEAIPFEACLTKNANSLKWEAKEVEDQLMHKAHDLVNQGYSQRQAANELGMSKSAFNRQYNNFKNQYDKYKEAE